MVSILAQLSSCTALLFTCLLNADSYKIKIQDEWLKTIKPATAMCATAQNNMRRSSQALTNATKDVEKTDIKTIDPENIPADLAYWIADIKLDNNGVKIIEFGDGNFAGYKVLDNMYHPGKMWEVVWKNLLSLDIPVWYVGSYSGDPGVVAWNSFKANGGHYSQSLETLQRHGDFLRHAKKQTNLFPEKITDYQGIIVLKRYNPPAATVKKFTSRYPDFLILNDTSTVHVSDKNLTDGLFNTPELRAFRPKAIILPKKYTSTLAQEITAQIPSKWLVIKPINSGRGNGIIMVNKAHLDEELHKVLVDYKNYQTPNNDISVKMDPPLSYDYWKADRNTHFLVEEYCESKPILVNNKSYDATMRVIFMMRFEQGAINLDFLDAYWKRPIKALSESGTFKEKHISKHAPTFDESQGLAVSAEDFALVKKSMSKALPQVYWNILASYYAAN